MELRRDEIQSIVDLMDEREEIAFVCRRISSLIGNVLSVFEMALPEGKQCSVVKKQSQNVIYDGRNDILRHFYNRKLQWLDNGRSEKPTTQMLIDKYSDLNYIAERCDTSMSSLKQILDIALTGRSYNATLTRVTELFEEVKHELIWYFYDNYEVE